MMQLKKLFKHILLSSCLVLTSCGYMSDDAVENVGVYKSEELQTCKIDVSKLGEIFKADQKQQIKCLEENFIQFTKYVRAKNPGSINEAEMGQFVKKFFEGQSDAIIKGLSLIFQLNMLLLKDEADRITNSNISPLFTLLVQVNQEAVTITDIIKHMDSEQNQKDFWEQRVRFNETTTRFAKLANDIIASAPGYGQKLNIRKFLLDMSSKLGDGQLDNDTIDSFIFLKKVVLGGEEEVVSTEEIQLLLNKLPKILGLIFDLYYVKAENFENQIAEKRFYLLSVRNLYHAVNFSQEDFDLLTSEQVVKLAKKIFKEDVDVEKFKPSIELLKQKFIGGKKDIITLRDVEAVFMIFHDLAEKLYYNAVTYQDLANTKVLSFTRPLNPSDLPIKELPAYDIYPNKSRLLELHMSFVNTATTFRYFRTPADNVAIYDAPIIRNQKGFNEVNIAKWLGKKLLLAYGHKDQYGNLQITMDEFSQFLLDTKPILEELNLWTTNFKNFSRNAVLLADLFQEKSNGDLKINEDEATEYIIMLLTAVELSGKVADQMKASCSLTNKEKEVLLDADCFNDRFYDVLLNQLNFKTSFPRLENYVLNSSKEEAIEYLKGVEGFARDNNAPGIPINRRDSTLIIGAMLNIETTFIRFDTNNDNIIDYNELNQAFLVYKNSIIDLAGLKKEQEGYALGIFLYMVSKMEIPKTGTWITDVKFASFNSCVQRSWCRNTFLSKIEAKRLNIGKLLYYMVNQPQVAKSKPATTKE